MPFIGYDAADASSVASSTLATTTTVGDGTAEDGQIRFDGNTLDYHIGLDDSGDVLTIGKGSSLGTTTAMTFNSDGIVSKPLNSLFSAQHSVSNQNNVAVNTDHTMAFGREFCDANGDYDNSNYIFTAPVAGTYQFVFHLRVNSVDCDGTNFINWKIVTSNATYVNKQDPQSWGISDASFLWYCHAITDMDEGDTCKAVFKTGAGTAQTDMSYNDNIGYTSNGFGGYLVG